MQYLLKLCARIRRGRRRRGKRKRGRGRYRRTERGTCNSKPSETDNIKRRNLEYNKVRLTWQITFLMNQIKAVKMLLGFLSNYLRDNDQKGGNTILILFEYRQHYTLVLLTKTVTKFESDSQILSQETLKLKYPSHFDHRKSDL